MSCRHNATWNVLLHRDMLNIALIILRVSLAKRPHGFAMGNIHVTTSSCSRSPHVARANELGNSVAYSFTPTPTDVKDGEFGRSKSIDIRFSLARNLVKLPKRL